MAGKDGETRTRVLREAIRLFAARGFEKVTVREICLDHIANFSLGGVRSLRSKG